MMRNANNFLGLPVLGKAADMTSVNPCRVDDVGLLEQRALNVRRGGCWCTIPPPGQGLANVHVLP